VELRELRRERALSQQDLADKSGVSKTTIVNLESGKMEPRPSTARKLAAALGLTPQEFMRQIARVER
jgi:transcriptional regulator with XRE-family HTH domain